MKREPQSGQPDPLRDIPEKFMGDALGIRLLFQISETGDRTDVDMRWQRSRSGAEKNAFSRRRIFASHLPLGGSQIWDIYHPETADLNCPSANGSPH